MAERKPPAKAEEKHEAVKHPTEMIEREQKQGYRGFVTDPTPNDHYTVKGVTAGKPTPETDKALQKKIREQEHH